MKNRKTNAAFKTLGRVSVAVISDVHAYEGGEPDKAPSHCCITENDRAKNSLVGLREFIRDNKITADILVCPGDIGDKAQPVAIQHAWKELHAIKKILRARDFATTTGNHDVDSRYEYNHYDAKGMLQALDPKYPFPNDALNDSYWSKHFVTITRDDYRILVLNSSAFHGAGLIESSKCHEHEQGRVSDYTLGAIRRALEENAAVPPVNILLCHHHPHPHSELGLREADLMIGSAVLLELLGTGRYGRWIVIHGHKHHPKLENAAGGAAPPIVFAAGSVGAVLYRELGTASRNQFYLLEFPIDQFSKFGFVGRFHAWDWLSNHGWTPAPKTSRLPEIGGFGWRGDIDVLASEVAKQIKTKPMRWADLVAKLPKLDYLLPQDIELLVHKLRTDPTMTVEPDRDIPPTLIGRQR